MSKELEALEELKNFSWVDGFDCLIYLKYYMEEQLNIIETALKRLEKYDLDLDFAKDCQICGLKPYEQAIKELKAFDIIKDLIELHYDENRHYITLKNHETSLVIYPKEKCDLLKEMLL